MMAGRKLILREAVPDEAPAIIAALEAWRRQEEANGKPNYVLPRPEDDLRKTAAKGLYFIVLDADSNELLAVSGVFDLRSDPDVCVEVGGTYVDTAIRERGFQSLFFEIRVVMAMILNGARVRITTAIDPNNEDSYRNAVRRNHFTEMLQALPEHTGEACRGCEKPKKEKFDCCCEFYEISIEGARKLATAFVDRLSHAVDGKITLGRDDKVVEVSLQCQLAVDEAFRGALVSFASGEWPDV